MMSLPAGTLTSPVNVKCDNQITEVIRTLEACWDQPTSASTFSGRVVKMNPQAEKNKNYFKKKKTLFKYF